MSEDKKKSGKEKYKLAYTSTDESSKLELEVSAKRGGNPNAAAATAPQTSTVATGMPAGVAQIPPHQPSAALPTAATVVGQHAQQQRSASQLDASTFSNKVKEEEVTNPNASKLFHSADSAEFTQVNQSLADVTIDLQTLTLTGTPRALLTPHAPFVSQPPVMNANEELLLLRQEKHQWGIEKRAYLQQIEVLELDKQRKDEAIRDAALQREAMERENRELREKCARLEQQLTRQQLEALDDDGNRTVVEVPNRSEDEEESNADGDVGVEEEEEEPPTDEAEESDAELAESEEDGATDAEEDAEEDEAECDHNDGQHEKWEFMRIVQNKEELEEFRAQNQAEKHKDTKIGKGKQQKVIYFHCNQYQLKRGNCAFTMKAVQSADGTFEVFKSGDHNHTVVPIKMKKRLNWIPVDETVHTLKELKELSERKNVRFVESSSTEKLHNFRCWRRGPNKQRCKFQLKAVIEDNRVISVYQSKEHNHDVKGNAGNAAGPSTSRK